MALDLIADVMGWDDARATKEYAWLRMMSSIKYDGYADYRAGARFVESLVVWLKQFKVGDREFGYAFIKSRLVYISPAELQCLIDVFFPEVVTPALREATATALAIKPYQVWQTPSNAALFESKRRRTLFIGMSDGSRTDILRRANSGRMSPEQVVATLIIDDDKWEDLGNELQNDEGAGAKFERVYLVEDFTGSGTTFIRQVDGKWKGKLHKFEHRIHEARKVLKEKFPLAEGYDLHVHHYISTSQAREALEERLNEAMTLWEEKSFGSVTVTEGLRLPSSTKLSRPSDQAILDLCDKYHDPGLDERLRKHLKQSGIDSVRYGYAECALPLVLDHNTPNNTIALLWAQTGGGQGRHAMDSLFQRRDRHG